MAAPPVTVEDRGSAPRAPLVIEPLRGWVGGMWREAWEYRELLYFLVWRDLKVRYKQTAIGAAWAVLQPLLAALLFTLVFGRFAGLPSDGVPYPIFAYVGLLPWQLFAYALTESTNSVVTHQQLIKKVYFPRIFLPLTPVVAAMVDFVVAGTVLVGLLAVFRVAPSGKVLLLPVALLGAVMAAFAVAVWLAALNAKYRDVRYAVPFLVQVWFFATPIVYPSSVIPAPVRPLWALNPMASVVDAFRWALLGAPAPPLAAVSASCAAVLLLLVGGVRFFRRTEATIAEIV
ncbi:MAG: ABC transporter permease [Acidobacteriota bacterium]|jgi:lipopolysaccharide transport system permease protein